MRYAARHGFTLVELLVVVAIIAVMLSTAALSVGSGTTAVRMKNATRSVWQLSGYARTMALLRQHPVVITYSEVWEGDEFVKSKIEVKAGSESTSSAPEVSTSPAPSIYDPEAEMPEPENEEKDSEESVVAEGTDEAAQEFPGVRLKVEMLGEDGEVLGGGENRKAVSVFSNVDFLLGRNRAAKGKEEDKKGSGTRALPSEDDDEPKQETREPVSIVFETNGRCEPHRILVWKDGKDEDSATVLEVDRFGAIKNPDAEDDRR